LVGRHQIKSAAGQTTGSGANNGPSSQLVMQPVETETPAYVAPQLEHQLGDLGGVRANLENLGIYLRLPHAVRPTPRGAV
jgi:hypothetical protein